MIININSKCVEYQNGNPVWMTRGKVAKTTIATGRGGGFDSRIHDDEPEIWHSLIHLSSSSLVRRNKSLINSFFAFFSPSGSVFFYCCMCLRVSFHLFVYSNTVATSIPLLFGIIIISHLHDILLLTCSVGHVRSFQEESCCVRFGSSSSVS